MERSSPCLLAACLALTLGASPAPAMAATAKPSAQVGTVHAVNIAALPLGAALNELSSLTGTPIGYAPELVAGQRSAAVAGRLTLPQALNRLLSDSGLVATPAGAGFVIQPAQAMREPAMLEVVSVTASAARADATEGSGQYLPSGPSRTATGLALTRQQTPQSVSVVTQQQMRDADMQSLDDVIDATPGLTYAKLGTERSSFYSRGFQVIDLHVDGVATSISENFSADAISFNNMAIYDRVEVVRGATGLLQGAGTPSASINLIRKRPTREFGMSAEFSAGSWADYRSQFDVAGPLNPAGTLRGRAVLFDNQANGFKQGAGVDNKILYAVTEADVSPATTVTVGMTAQRDNHRAYDWGGFSTREDGSFYDLDRSASLAGPGSHLDRDGLSTFADATHRLAKDWAISAAVTAQRWETSFLANYPTRVAPGIEDLTFVNAEYEDRQTSSSLTLGGPFQMFGRQHDLMLSASLRKANFDFETRSGLTQHRVELADVDFAAIRVPVLEDTPDRSELQRSEKGVTMATRLRPTDALSVILGTRASWSGYQSRSQTGTASFNAGRQLVPYAGVVVDVNPAHALYASYTDVYMVSQSYGPAGLLKPVQGRNYEIGLKSEFMQGRFQTALALFQTEQLNLPVALDIPARCGLTGMEVCNTEGGKVRSRGIEFEASGALTPRWNAAFNVTLNDRSFVAGPDRGKRYETNQPRAMAKVMVDYRLPGQQWQVGGSVRAQSRMYRLGEGFRIEQRPYAVLDLHAAYQVNSHLRLQFNLRNALDRRYVQTIPTLTDWGGTFVGSPRTVTAILRYDY